MHIRIIFFVILFIFFGFEPVFSQGNTMYSGRVVNAEDEESLPFASIRLKNHPIGTISNENGEFDFYIPKSQRTDTLNISFIGFNPYEIPLENINGELLIKLTPSNNVLDEIVLTKKSPLDYIKMAIDKIPDNYPQEPFQSTAYFRERFFENGAVIKKDEAVFKSYYPKPEDSSKNQHQLLLYRPEQNPQQFQFMRDWYEKKQSKKKKKAEKKGEEFDENEFENQMDVGFGGPETVLQLGITNKRERFLNPKNFKKYEYSFGEETSLNGERLINIDFKAKRRYDHIRDSGSILINTEDYAIVSIKHKGNFSVPFVVKPILFVIGLKIGTPTFENIASYQKFKDKWYPQLFRWDANVNLTKKHTFSANEHSTLNIGQVFFINALDSIATPIEKSVEFDASEKMSEQVHNTIDMQWGELNIVKD